MESWIELQSQVRTSVRTNAAAAVGRRRLLGLAAGKQTDRQVTWKDWLLTVGRGNVSGMSVKVGCRGPM